MPAGTSIVPNPIAIATPWTYTYTFDDMAYTENPAVPGTYFSVTYSSSTISNPVIVSFNAYGPNIRYGSLVVTFTSTGYDPGDEFKYIPRGSSDLIVPSTVTTTSSTTSINTASSKVFSFVAGNHSTNLVTYTIYLQDSFGPMTSEFYHTVSSSYPGFSGTGSLDLKQYR